MISVLISMYDEDWTVKESVGEVRRVFPDAHIFVVRSGGVPVQADVNGQIVLPNLASESLPYELPSKAITRNFSTAFQNAHPDSEYIVAITGDTLVVSAGNFDRRFANMKYDGKVLACSQAIGQDFHAPDSDPRGHRCGGRFQFDGISDFMPQFWVVDGKFARETGAFKTIAITNKYTSEQCLGDEFMRHVKGSFSDNALVLSKTAYDYSDGIKYNTRAANPRPKPSF